MGHGGTPNLSESHRPMPNAEFTALYMCRGKADGIFETSMPRNVWEGLSDRGKELAKYIVAEQGQVLKPHVDHDIPLGGNSGSRAFFDGFQPAPLFQPCSPALESNF